ncbi:MAG: hypothetical protein RL615_392, partial [Pseudomonadota bacterium]
MLTSLPPLSLYVHIPWCIKKCPYCDFNSHQIKDVKEAKDGKDAKTNVIDIHPSNQANEANQGFDEKRYLEALRLDLQSTLPKVWGRRIHSIFIGGGTP